MFQIKTDDKVFNVFIIAFVVAMLSSCSAFREVPENDLMLEMEKTPCYGFCPVYKVRIGYSGRGTFVGKDNIEPIGSYTFKMGYEDLSSIVQALEEAKFFEFKDRYYENYTDLPTTYITYVRGGMRKKVMDYYGAPEELKLLEAEIEDLVLQQKMKPVEEE